MYCEVIARSVNLIHACNIRAEVAACCEPGENAELVANGRCLIVFVVVEQPKE